MLRLSVAAYEARLALRQPRRIPGAVGRRARRLWRRAALRTLAALGRPVAIELPERVRLLLPADDELARELWTRKFEEPEREFVRRSLRPGDVFYDVGAHAGLYTAIAARVVAPGGHVFAFEPNPTIFPLLERNVAANGLSDAVDAAAAALGEAKRTLALYVPDARHSAWASFARPITGADSTVDVDVDVITLDELAARTQLPYLVKLDVEGWETRVLAGGATLLASAEAPHLLVEFTDAVAAAAGSSTRELYDRLVELGYGLYRYRRDTRALEPEPFRGAYPYDNLVATKRPQELGARLSGAWDDSDLVRGRET